MKDKFKILLVEDTREIIKVIGSTIEYKLRKYSLNARTDFSEGLKFARDNDFDVAVIDNSLPNFDLRIKSGDGLDLAFRIKQFKPNAKIIVYSGHTWKEVIETKDPTFALWAERRIVYYDKINGYEELVDMLADIQKDMH